MRCCLGGFVLYGALFADYGGCAMFKLMLMLVIVLIVLLSAALVAEL